MLTNPGTGFDEDGWSDIISDVRRLALLLEGGSNDLNAGTVAVDQDTADASPAVGLTADEVQALIDEALSDSVYTSVNVYAELFTPQSYGIISGATVVFDSGLNTRPSGGLDTTSIERNSFDQTTGRFTVPFTGVYFFNTNLEVNCTAAASNIDCTATIYLNQNTGIGSTVTHQQLPVGLVVNIYIHTVSTVAYLQAGETVEVFFQNSFSSTAVTVTGNFNISRVG